MGCSDFRPLIPPRFVASLGGTADRPLLRSHGGAGESRRGPGPLFTRWSRAGMLYAETVGPPRFLENPHADIPPSKDPGGPVTPCCSGVPMLPSAKPTASAPATNLCFRGSITRTARSLCTLRRPGHPDATQHSVPAGSKPWPDGIGYPQGSREKFQKLFTLSPPPRLCLAHRFSKKSTCLLRAEQKRNPLSIAK